MKQKLLFIDDNEMMRAFLEHYFGQHYHVKSVVGGSAAWQWLDDGNLPELIILDLRMPDIPGLELLNQLKSSVLYNDIPVIILSSVESSKERVACLEAGAADYVVKPFNPQELEIRIRYHLRVSKV